MLVLGSFSDTAVQQNLNNMTSGPKRMTELTSPTHIKKTVQSIKKVGQSVCEQLKQSVSNQFFPTEQCNKYLLYLLVYYILCTRVCSNLIRTLLILMMLTKMLPTVQITHQECVTGQCSFNITSCLYLWFVNVHL